MMPPGIACRFTTGETAVLAIVATEVRHRGRCDRSLAELAARAGVCLRLAQLAIRQAERLGLLVIEERRVAPFRNETNIITIASPEWRAWLAHRPRETGCKQIRGTYNKFSTEEETGWNRRAVPPREPLGRSPNSQGRPRSR
jgi:hypothetical protein